MKKIHRFLQQEQQPTPQLLTEKRIVHQVVRVLRLKPHEQISLFFNGGPNRLVELISLSTDHIEIKPISEEGVVLPKRTVIAALALTKHDHFEIAVQKLSELGITEIVPLITERTIKTNIRTDRLQSISDEAVELSGGTARVVLHEPMTLIDATKMLKQYQWIICDQRAPRELQKAETCVYAIGPEGGWGKEELSAVMDTKPLLWSLAERTLRAETAAILAGYKLLWE